jgi:predicted nucleic acid-binding protein
MVDSGIWISALQFGDNPQAAVDSVVNDHTIAICDQIIAEVCATLVRKFAWKDEEVRAMGNMLQ